MLERISRLILVVLAVAAAAFPTLYPEELHKHSRPFVAISLGLAVAAIWWQRQYDSSEARKKQRLSHKLALQESRGDTLKSMMEFLTVPILLLEQDHNWTPEEKQEGVAKLSAAMTQVLRALSKDVSVYVAEKPDASVNTNLMVAHRVSGASGADFDKLAEAAVFLGFKRPLASYAYALELTLWDRPETDVPPLVLPVEDPQIPAGNKRLLPGAPAAIASAWSIF